MIREFMASDVPNDLVIITNVEKNKFYEELRQKHILKKIHESNLLELFMMQNF